MVAVAVAPFENFDGHVPLPPEMVPDRMLPAAAEASTAPDCAVMLDGTVHWHSLLGSFNADGAHGINTAGHSLSPEPPLAWQSHCPCEA
jgi:hypothetical protein